MRIKINEYYLIEGKDICVCTYIDDIFIGFSVVDRDEIIYIYKDKLNNYRIELW